MKFTKPRRIGASRVSRGHIKLPHKVYYYDHTHADIVEYIRACERTNNLITTGVTFHPEWSTTVE